MYLQAFKRNFSFIDQEESGFDIYLQILEVISSFVFSVTGTSRVRIGNHDRHWKAGSEDYLLIVIKSACVHIQSSIFSV